ncbi:MAG TPA: VTT domain-containing protein [Terriglobales bacterium]|nr:VTT domain-containing protein [Terriglobales bacterium]
MPLTFLASPLVHWLHRLGAPGLLLLGLVDNSPLPLPGSMDLLTIWLAARDPRLWPLYATVATAGSLLGGYVTYALARRGGKHAVERRLSKKTAGRLYRYFERWGFFAVVLPALLPPPVPIVPFLVAAGALQYPPRKFLWALGVGRAFRFTVIASLGAVYGRHIVRFFARYYQPMLWIVVGLAVFGGLLSVVSYLRHGRKAHESAPQIAHHKTV